MKTCWLNRQNNKNLIVFFAGWSFDAHPFCDYFQGETSDILMVYDYNSLELPEELTNLPNYQHKTLIGWSMGVFAAYVNRELFKDFDCKIALNGTVTPVDNDYGIPVKIFELTLKHASTGLGGKFYKNLFNNAEKYEIYAKNPVQRSVENRVSELETLYAEIKQRPQNEVYENFYDFAIVCEEDKIIPPANQEASHKKNKVPVIKLPYGHFPFYDFSKWNEIKELCK